jgi:hypothetical protein
MEFPEFEEIPQAVGLTDLELIIGIPGITTTQSSHNNRNAAFLNTAQSRTGNAESSNAPHWIWKCRTCNHMTKNNGSRDANGESNQKCSNPQCQSRISTSDLWMGPSRTGPAKFTQIGEQPKAHPPGFVPRRTQHTADRASEPNHPAGHRARLSGAMAQRPAARDGGSGSASLSSSSSSSLSTRTAPWRWKCYSCGEIMENNNSKDANGESNQTCGNPECQRRISGFSSWDGGGAFGLGRWRVMNFNPPPGFVKRRS